MDSRSTLNALEADGWILNRVTGSHHPFMHPTKPGLTTVPYPKKNLPVGTVRAIEPQSGISLLR